MQELVDHVPLESDVVHELCGRVRLRVPGIRGDAQLAECVCAFLSRQPGVREVRATPECASIVVSHDPGVVTPTQIVSLLTAGVPTKESRIYHRPTERDRGALLAGGAALSLSLLGAPAAVTAVLLAASSVPVVLRAIRGVLDEGQLSADALDATAIGVLLVRGDIPAAALSASLIAGGEYIRSMTARRSRGALNGLLDGTGRQAWVVRGRHKQRVPADTVRPGETVVVYPGELVVVDGVVLRGRALVDQQVLTGESASVLKLPGDPVYASTVLTDGKLYMRAEQVGNATRASRIVQLLDDAPLHDTRLANYARQFADRLVVPTLVLSTGLLVVTRDVTRAISVLIFDFATGIRVSAPTTVLATMTAAVHQEIVIKGGRALEVLATVDTLVFDKTGTLTPGAPSVVDVQSLVPELTPDQVLVLAAAAERRLTHPAAQAIVRAAEARRLPIPERGDSHYIVGLGVEAEIDDRRVLVGSAQLFARHSLAISNEARDVADTAARQGISTVFVGRDSELVGAVCYADVPRSEARAVIQRLRDRGIRECVMVTGDSRLVAEVIARQVGIEHVEAEVFPEQKAEIVRALQAQGRVVAVVGDGINDSPALAYADVSVSLKAGSDVARETADVVLHGDLHGLPEAIDLGRQAMRLLRQNLTIVGIPNAAGMLLASVGLVGPVAATALNNGSNVTAALNGLRPLIVNHSGANGLATSDERARVDAPRDSATPKAYRRAYQEPSSAAQALAARPPL
jgi:heavy metal translocating P-type ATPase